MTSRNKRAIEFAKRVFLYTNPELADPEVRKMWWKFAHPIEKKMIMQTLIDLAVQDLEKVEELVVVEDV